MKKQVHAVLRVGLPLILFIYYGRADAQTTFYHRYIIEFTDKSNSPFSISEPEVFLSQKAIDRRQRYHIPVTETDLPVNPEYLQAVASKGVTLLNASKWFNSVSIATDDSLALLAIQQLPFVKSALPVATKKAASQIRQAGKPLPVSQKDAVIPSDYGTGFHQVHMLQGDYLHNLGFRGEGMTIASLDAGWYNTLLLDVFDSLLLEGRLLGHRNFVARNDSVFGSSTHGTEVLSLMAADKPGKLIGSAPKANYYLLLTEDVASEYPIEEHNWAVAAEYADSLGVDIITSSLGYSEFDDPLFNYTYEDMDGKTALSSRAATMASRTGMLVCSSAGNQGLTPWHFVTAPGDADSILTVGATDSTGTITAFSSYGPSSDGRTKPNVVAQGIGVWVVDPAVENNTTFPGNGTSFSNPLTAGLAACLWQAHPEKNNMEIISAIERSASLSNRPNDSMGFGIPNFALADKILSGEAPDDLDLESPVLYPNPFTEVFALLYYVEIPEQIQMEIFNVSGQLLYRWPASLQAGYNFLQIGFLSDAPNGAYFLRVTSGNDTEIFRLLKGFN